LRQDFESLKVHEPEGLAAYFLLDDRSVRQLAARGALNTDDRTLLEYDAPRSLLASESIDQDRALITHFQSGALPSLAPEEIPRALSAGLATALDLGDVDRAQALIQHVKPKAENCFLHIVRGRLDLLQNELAHAKESFEEAIELDKKSPDAAYWLAVALRREGDNSAALTQIENTLTLSSSFLPALQEKMELAAEQGDYRVALSAQLRRMALIRDVPAYEYGRLGALWLDMSDVNQAESALQKGLEKDPYCYACHLELGEAYTRRNELIPARKQFEWVIRFFPDAGSAAFTSLAVIDHVLKDEASAQRVLNEGLRLFPNEAGLLKAKAALSS
jgi:tetratricopeptide (TPR) repeat protein